MDIYDSMKPFNNLLKVFGLFPITFDKKGNFELKICDILLSLISLVVLVTVIFINVVQMTGQVMIAPNGSMFMSHVWNVLWMFGLCSLVIVMIHQGVRYKSKVKIYSTVNKVDSKVSSWAPAHTTFVIHYRF